MGAGIFVLPYVFYHSNFSFAVSGLILVTFLVAQINLFYTDIILATPGDHQLAGYAGLYCGPRLRIIALINFLLLEVGALLAYVILSARFLTTLVPALSSTQASLIFFFAVVIFHLNRLKILGRYYQVIPILAVIFIYLLLSAALFLPAVASAKAGPNWSFFGPLIFALSGFTIIPEVEELLRRHHQLLRPASLLGLIIAALLYLLFSFSVVKLSFPHLSVDAITGLSQSLPLFGSLLSVLGLFLVFEASLNLLLVFKETFYRDFNFKESLAYLFSLLILVFCFIFSKVSLLTVVSLTGSVTLFLAALIICLIRLKISHPPLIIFRTFLILLVFLIGLVSEFL